MHFHSFHLQLVGLWKTIHKNKKNINKHWDQWLAETRHSHRGVGVQEELAKVKPAIRPKNKRKKIKWWIRRCVQKDKDNTKKKKV